MCLENSKENKLHLPARNEDLSNFTISFCSFHPFLENSEINIYTYQTINIYPNQSEIFVSSTRNVNGRFHVSICFLKTNYRKSSIKNPWGLFNLGHSRGGLIRERDSLEAYSKS